jgi:hypothetical protein
MLVFKVISGLAAMALGAAAVLLMPVVSHDADAGVPPPIVKSNRLDIQPMLTDCAQQAWPYYNANCLRGDKQASGGKTARPVRLISPDRVAAE